MRQREGVSQGRGRGRGRGQPQTKALLGDDDMRRVQDIRGRRLVTEQVSCSNVRTFSADVS